MATNIQTLKNMIAEPASKDWFVRHGSPKGSHQQDAMYKALNANTGRSLSKAESKAKTAGWPKTNGKGRVVGAGAPVKTDKDKRDYQSRYGRAYND